MSGPVTPADVDEAGAPRAVAPTVEVLESRTVELAGMPVRRALPKRARRTIGAWCFLDHFGPTPPGREMQIGPHPHIGLQTVTWLVEGTVLHRDSLGTEQRIVPGQLNLMTAGHGISHAEETPDDATAEQLGVQLWVAQPEATRHGDPAFEHHAELPTDTVGGWTTTVLTGALGGRLSPARTDTALVGASLSAPEGGRTRLDLDPTFEHGLVVLRGSVDLGTLVVEPGALVYVGPGHDALDLDGAPGTEAFVVGGEPFPEPVRMFWNFVGRTHEELAAAREDWMAADERYGSVASPLERIDAPPVL